MTDKISLVMITKNSSYLLEKTLKSVKGLVQEIIIVDDYSTDQTLQIAKSFSAKVFLNRESDLGKQRKYAVSQATNDWILILDADEYVSHSLKKEIKTILAKKTKSLAFLIPFQNHFLGKPLNHGGEQYSQIRLFSKKNVQISPSFLHENFTYKKGIPGKLNNKIYHFSYQSYSQVISKFTQYARREARQKIEKGEKTSLQKIFMYPLHMFYARFIKDFGYKDGWFRIPLDIAFAYMEFLTYVSMLFLSSKNGSKRVAKIAIDAGDYCPQTDTVKSGITRLIYNFTKEFNKGNIKNVHLTVYYFNSLRAKNTRYITYKKLPRRGFASFFLPFFAILDKNDSYVSFSSHIPILLSLTKIKKVAFLYDLAFKKYPQYYSQANKLSVMLDNTIKRADILITLTKYIESEVSKKYPIVSYKLVHIYPGTDHMKIITSKPIKKYFLYVGILKPIKNIEALFHCFNKFLSQTKNKSYKLILVGTWEKEYYQQLIKNSTYSKVKSNIIFAGPVSEDNLRSYYSHSTAVVNVSHAEGFGFPIAEALSMNKNVIVNNLPIYFEFKSNFKNLHIASSNKEIVEFMNKSTINKKQIAKNSQNNFFKWKSFTTKTISLATK